MSKPAANLAALIGSRICHDLISPIGAIANGIELLGMTGMTAGPEIGLISDSAGNAGARIRFFRIAYGLAGEQAMGRNEILSVLDDVSRGGRLKYEWAMTEAQPRALVRLAFLALQCCETAMPYGGTVRVDSAGGRWQVTGTAEKLNADPDLWADLTRTETQSEISAALVQFALLPVAVREAGCALQVTVDPNRIEIVFAQGSAVAPG